MARGPQSREALFQARRAHLWRHYRFTTEQWMAEYEHQHGCCYFCGKPGGDLYARGRTHREHEPLVYDHEHDPPYRFRGLGHARCNRLAGVVEKALKDPPAWQPGGVAHRVPADRVRLLESRARSSRESKRRKRAGVPGPRELARAERGERTTYTSDVPDPTVRGGRAAGLVALALAELEGLQEEQAG